MPVSRTEAGWGQSILEQAPDQAVWAKQSTVIECLSSRAQKRHPDDCMQSGLTHIRTHRQTGDQQVTVVGATFVKAEGKVTQLWKAWLLTGYRKLKGKVDRHLGLEPTANISLCVSLLTVVGRQVYPMEFYHEQFPKHFQRRWQLV